MSRGKGEWEALCEIRFYCMNTILCVTCFISQHQRHRWLKCGWYKTLDMQLKCSVAFTMTTLKSLFHLWDLLRTLNLVPCWLSGVTHVHLKTHTENSTKTTDINYSSQPFPPLERVRWLFDLGYCLLQALRVGNAFGSTFLEGISTPPSLPARSSTLFHRTDKGKPNSWHLFQLWLLQLSTQRNIWILMCTLSLIGLMWWFRMWII